MDPMRVVVGSTTTEIVFSRERPWPDTVWLEHVRRGAPGLICVVDRGVLDLTATRLGEVERAAICVPGRGEATKTWTGVECILNAAMDRGLGRDGCLVAIGGGAICDVTGFAASLYMRGLALELVPTTLLAMVDASVGGKTGINYRGTKNTVGAFHPARRITVFLSALASLPVSEIRSGLAEVIKAALLGQPGLWEILASEGDAIRARDPDVLGRLVRHSLELKARIVTEDPTEQGIRAHLNLGHTFGHALEAALGPGKLTHGEAVAWGVDRALEMGVRMGVTDRAYRAEVRNLLLAHGYRLTLAELAPGLTGSAPVLLVAMRQDKKKQAGRPRFVLQRALGDTFVTADVPPELVMAVLDQER